MFLSGGSFEDGPAPALVQNDFMPSFLIIFLYAEQTHQGDLSQLYITETPVGTQH